MPKNPFPKKKVPAKFDNSIPAGMTRYRCVVEYDGTDFHGWQSQVCGNAIQDHLERRLREITREEIRIHGSGRTDSGVHARGQVFHFDCHWHHAPETLLRALNSGLPAGIVVRKTEFAKNGFHARFSARGKRYRYQIVEGFPTPFEQRFCWGIAGTLDVDVMQRAAAMLLGTHDFSAFGANHASAERENPVKTLARLDVSRRGNKISIVTEASGYLYKMVRRLVGGLVKVGQGKMSPEELLAYREARICDARVPTAPARGLTMEKAFY